ncbi:MAG: CYTH domain-containing protein [Candidatus Altiarchaeota archaeon]
MRETEVKILEVDRKKIEKKLAQLGAEKVFDGEVFAVYFDFRDRRIEKSKGTFRLRKVGDRSYLTFKEFVEHDSMKVRQEHEVEVSDFDKVKHMLESLGMASWLTTKKQRTSYKLGKVHFELDLYSQPYDSIPEFLEIEAEDDETLLKYVKLLGFKKSECKPWTLLDLAEHYSRQNRAPVS